MPPLVQGRRIFHTIPLDGAFLSKALRQQELVPNGTRPRPARTVMCRQPHRRVLVLPWTLQRSWAHPSGVARHTRPRTLQSPGGPRACVWPPRRRRGRVPSRRSEWWDCTSTFSCPPSQKDARTYVPDATSPKLSQGVRRPSTYPYTPKCLDEGVFSEVLRCHEGRGGCPEAPR